MEARYLLVGLMCLLVSTAALLMVKAETLHLSHVELSAKEETLDSSYDYCMPNDLKSNSLGNVYQSTGDDNGLDLKFLILITRHGDRTPTVSLADIQLPEVQPQVVWNCTENGFSYPTQGFNDSNVAIPRAYRLQFIPGRNELLGNCYTGQLTSVGANQHMKLGSLLRKRYVDDLKFLSDKLNTSEFWVRSTNVYRTIQSAQNLLLGLYPPAARSCDDLEEIDINSIDEEMDNLTPNHRLCPRIIEIVQDLENSPLYREHLKNVSSNMTNIRKSLNVSDDYPMDWIGLFDISNARLCHDFPAPGYLNKEQLQFLNEEGKYEMNYFYLSLPYFQDEPKDNLTNLRMLGMGSFVAEMVSQINMAMMGENPYKMVYYSGHDTTLGPLLQTLQMGPGYWPPYASHLLTELWQDKDGQFYISSTYNGEQVQPATCSSSNSMCLAQDYLANAYSTIPNDYNKACQCQTPNCGLDKLSLRELMKRTSRIAKTTRKWRFF